MSTFLDTTFSSVSFRRISQQTELWEKSSGPSSGFIFGVCCCRLLSDVSVTLIFTGIEAPTQQPLSQANLGGLEMTAP